MIKAVLIFNTDGKPRLIRFYQQVVSVFPEVGKKFHVFLNIKTTNVCNFIDGNLIELVGEGAKIIYRHYATLFFVFIVDEAESELAILDLIQVLVESLDRVFENVCELDLVFNFKEVQYILNEVVSGGMVLETSVQDISEAVSEYSKEKPSARLFFEHARVL